MIELKLIGAALCWVAAFWIRSRMSQETSFDLTPHLQYKPTKRVLEFRTHSAEPTKAMAEAAHMARMIAAPHLSHSPVKLDRPCVQKAIVDGMFIRLDNAGFEADAYIKNGAYAYVVTFVGEPGVNFEAHTYIVVLADWKVYRAYENEGGHPVFAFIDDATEVDLSEMEDL
jgi:hypothetical protein